MTIPPSLPNVSVITPFYNTAKYIRQCIESVLNQTHRNYEYILVDNQSDDGSGDIAREYAEKDPRIRLIRTPVFLDQVENYNFSLQQISCYTEYCKIVQADDWVFPNCLSEMLSTGDANPTAAIISSYALEDRIVAGTGLPPECTVLSGREACRLFLIGNTYMFGSPTQVLYRSDVVRNRQPFFDVGRYHEDTEAVFEILKDHAFAFVHQVLTYTRVHSDSISGAAQYFSPNDLDRIILLKRFGNTYLETKEYEQALKTAFNLYYRNFARLLLKNRSMNFWRYHEKGLEMAEEKINLFMITRHAIAIVLQKLLPPVLGDVLKQLLRR